LLLSCQIASAQVESGSVVFINFAQDEITIAADSRLTTETGKHDDTECKISAFGTRFAFTMAGASRRAGQWSAHSEARDAWTSESKAGPNNTLLLRVAQNWIRRMEMHYSDADLIKDVTGHLDVDSDPVVAAAAFASVDDAGKLAVLTVNIDFDLKLFDSTSTVKLVHRIADLPVGGSAGVGHSDVIDERMDQSTQRARDYLKSLRDVLATLPPEQQRAETAYRFVEQSILLSRKKDELGFPIDVLQIHKGTGVEWVRRKPNCPSE
jgi:hypothetical protein